MCFGKIVSSLSLHCCISGVLKKCDSEQFYSLTAKSRFLLFWQVLIHFPLIILIPGSMLHAMFSGRFDTKPSEDGSYFIDRDGTHFRYILNYLRTGQLIVPQDELVRIREELLAEAEFYQVEGIIKVLTPKPEPKPQPKPQPKNFKNSMILSLDQGETLTNWLKEIPAFTNVNDVVLYRASRDGWAASNFHSCCDSKGATVTVVKNGNYIFGGYTEQLWEGRSYINAPRVLPSLKLPDT